MIRLKGCVILINALDIHCITVSGGWLSKVVVGRVIKKIMFCGLALR